MLSGSWPALREKFAKHLQSLRFDERYRSMRAGCRPLEPFPDPRRLLDYLRGPVGTAESKNRVLHALLRCRHEDNDVADIILTLALWPALDGIYRRLNSGFSGDAAAVAGELIGAFGAACRSADPDRITTVAATLTMNARRDATRSLVNQKALSSCLNLEMVHDNTVAEDADAFSADDREGAAEREIIERLRRDFGKDADLLIDVVVDGWTQREAAERRGLSHDAGRKRYQRTIARLRKQPPDYLRPRVPSHTPDWHLTVEGPGAAGATTEDTNADVERQTPEASGTVPAVGAARGPADRRRVSDRTRCPNDRRRNSRRGVPPRR